MPQLNFSYQIKSIILDIEGTICPISFVHDTLFPYFLAKLDTTLSKYPYPIANVTDDISGTIAEFPKFTSQADLSQHIHTLVNNDVKDPILKKLQGLIWLQGYQSGELSCPIYEDAVEQIQNWNKIGKTIYIYSSGSVKAQKLLLKHNKSGIDLNLFVVDYFDTVNIGSKLQESSYEKIQKQVDGRALFLSDNVNELNLAQKSMDCCLVDRPGNKPAEFENKVTTFDDLL